MSELTQAQKLMGAFPECLRDEEAASRVLKKIEKTRGLTAGQLLTYFQHNRSELLPSRRLPPLHIAGQILERARALLKDKTETSENKEDLFTPEEAERWYTQEWESLIAKANRAVVRGAEAEALLQSEDTFAQIFVGGAEILRKMSASMRQPWASCVEAESRAGGPHVTVQHLPGHKGHPRIIVIPEVHMGAFPKYLATAFKSADDSSLFLRTQKIPSVYALAEATYHLADIDPDIRSSEAHIHSAKITISTRATVTAGILELAGRGGVLKRAATALRIHGLQTPDDVVHAIETAPEKMLRIFLDLDELIASTPVKTIIDARTRIAVLMHMLLTLSALEAKANATLLTDALIEKIAVLWVQQTRKEPENKSVPLSEEATTNYSLVHVRAMAASKPLGKYDMEYIRTVAARELREGVEGSEQIMASTDVLQSRAEEIRSCGDENDPRFPEIVKTVSGDILERFRSCPSTPRLATSAWEKVFLATIIGLQRLRLPIRTLPNDQRTLPTEDPLARAVVYVLSRELQDLPIKEAFATSAPRVMHFSGFDAERSSPEQWRDILAMRAGASSLPTADGTGEADQIVGTARGLEARSTDNRPSLLESESPACACVIDYASNGRHVTRLDRTGSALHVVVHDFTSRVSHGAQIRDDGRVLGPNAPEVPASERADMQRPMAFVRTRSREMLAVLSEAIDVAYPGLRDSGVLPPSDRIIYIRYNGELHALCDLSDLDTFDIDALKQQVSMNDTTQTTELFLAAEGHRRFLPSIQFRRKISFRIPTVEELERQLLTIGQGPRGRYDVPAENGDTSHDEVSPAEPSLDDVRPEASKKKTLPRLAAVRHALLRTRTSAEFAWDDGRTFDPSQPPPDFTHVDEGHYVVVTVPSRNVRFFVSDDTSKSVLVVRNVQSPAASYEGSVNTKDMEDTDGATTVRYTDFAGFVEAVSRILAQPPGKTIYPINVRRRPDGSRRGNPLDQFPYQVQALPPADPDAVPLVGLRGGTVVDVPDAGRPAIEAPVLAMLREEFAAVAAQTGKQPWDLTPGDFEKIGSREWTFGGYADGGTFLDRVAGEFNVNPARTQQKKRGPKYSGPALGHDARTIVLDMLLFELYPDYRVQAAPAGEGSERPEPRHLLGRKIRRERRRVERNGNGAGGGGSDTGSSGANEPASAE